MGGEWLGSVRTSLLDGAFTIMTGAGTTLPFDGLIGIGSFRYVLGLAYTPAARAATVPTTPEAPPPPPRTSEG